MKKSIAVVFSILLTGIALMLISSCSSGPKLPPAPPGAVILAFGDSITYGTGAGEGQSYPAQLEKMIGRRVVNAGVPGEITAEGLERIAGVLEKEKPALVILCHGGNDILRKLDQRQTAENLRSMIRLAKSSGASVLMVAVPSLGLSLTPPQFYAEVAKETGLPIELKVLGSILGKASLKSDYIHPNAAGYEKLADAIADLLKRSGAISK
jgi:acyl-CoA thioesterase I